MADYLAAAGAFVATGFMTFVSVNRARDNRRKIRGEDVW